MANINPFEFMLPTTIKYGEEIIREIPASLKEYNVCTPMIVTGPRLNKLGAAKRVTDYLEAAGITGTIIYDKVQPNPRNTSVEEIARIAKENNVDSFIAIGGGSPIDSAKGAGLILSNGGRVKDYEGLVENLDHPTPPLFAIPTTVGTGSEVTFWAVIKDTKENYKLSIGTPAIAPNVAFVDPTFVDTLPGKIVASTGMDALTHAIEGYTCKICEPITDACGLYAIKLIGENIRKAVYNKGDKDAKANMLMGSLIAGICFGNSDVGGCHCMSEAIGGLYDIPHGVANAIMLPYTMEYNYVADLEKFANIADALGADIRHMTKREAAFASVKAIKELNADLKIPTLSETGAKEDDLDELAMRSAKNVSVEDNPRLITEGDFRAILEAALNE